MTASAFCRAALAAALLSLAACATASSEPSRWALAPDPAPVLSFSAKGSDTPGYRLSCDAGATRLAAWVPGVPRGTAADAAPFPARLRVFLGRTELDLGATATPTPGAETMVEAPLPDAAGFFEALKRNGRLVTVTFAGRGMAPVPAADLVNRFQQQCTALARQG